MKTITLNLTQNQCRKLTPFLKEILRVHKAGNWLHDYRLGCLANVNICENKIECALITYDQIFRIRKITANNRRAVLLEKIKIRQQLTL